MTMNSTDTGITPSGSTSPSIRDNVDISQLARLILFSHECPSGNIQDLLRRLHKYAKLPRFPYLARFLQECTSVLRQEVQKLQRPLRDSVPPFNDVVTLASHWEQLKKSSLCGAWEGAFLCIYEIAMLIGLVFARARCPSLGDRIYKRSCKLTSITLITLDIMKHTKFRTVTEQEGMFEQLIWQASASVSSRLRPRPCPCLSRT